MRTLLFLVLATLPLFAQIEQLPPTNPKITGRISASDKTWEEWVKRTGERPPDFEKLPSLPFLPDPLRKQSTGARITTQAEWQKQRSWIREQYQRWISGTFPPKPDNLRARITSERSEGDVRVREVVLEFGPDHRATLRVQLLIPPGKGPFPVFLTNHPRTRPWVATAVRRGYIGAIYHATDPAYGIGDDSDAYIELYPEYDFACLARWAWAGMRAVDYLVTLPEVNKAQIAISGHSRNGKQALMAAAFDDRIGAVALSSGNTGEGNPWRYTSDPFQNESIEQITGNFPHWFHPRLRFFTGREHKLPVDQNSLMALVAPRGLLMASAYSEAQGAPFGFEQAYRSVREVYRFVGAPGKIGLSLRAGEHATTAGDIEQYVDFFDTVFGRKAFARPETFVLGYSFESWRQLSGLAVNPQTFPKRQETAALAKEDIASMKKRLLWTLGDEPAGVPFPARKTLSGGAMTSDGWLAGLYNRPLRVNGASAVALPFGDDLKADLYYPVDAGGKPMAGPWPLVVWLHPLSYATGYSRYATQPLTGLTRRGFAVLAFDQIGFGARIHQAKEFYRRHPRWSLLGKMVADTRAAISAAAAIENIDSGRIYLMASSLGSKVALFTAALDDRVAALALFGGVAPLRLDKPELGTEGVRHYSHLHGLLPLLGFFNGQESRIPFDDDEALALVAPRPVFLMAPEFDRYSPITNVRKAIETARQVYARSGKQDELVLETPPDVYRYTRQREERMIEWLTTLARH